MVEDLVGKINRYEAGEMDYQEMVEFFQELLTSGFISHLQGSYHRRAQELINEGAIA